MISADFTKLFHAFVRLLFELRALTAAQRQLEFSFWAARCKRGRGSPEGDQCRPLWKQNGQDLPYGKGVTGGRASPPCPPARLWSHVRQVEDGPIHCPRPGALAPASLRFVLFRLRAGSAL